LEIAAYYSNYPEPETAAWLANCYSQPGQSFPVVACVAKIGVESEAQVNGSLEGMISLLVWNLRICWERMEYLGSGVSESLESHDVMSHVVP
jgi:hypothetical protein